MFPKNFTKASVIKEGTSYGVLLDDYRLTTPAKKEMIFDSRCLAEALVEEWQNAPDEINLLFMPINRLVNTALDHVTDYYLESVENVLAYASSDLLCYRATDPKGLVKRQNICWNPIIESLEKRYKLSFNITYGLSPFNQEDNTLLGLRHILMGTKYANILRLAGIMRFVDLSGSLLLSLAVSEKEIDIETAYEAIFLDDIFQIERWGKDEEAVNRLSVLKKEIQEVGHYFTLLSE